MKTSNWQLEIPIDAILFDCDGTLSMIEGIDELAKHNQVADAVQSLTMHAMNQSGLNPELYHQRLQLVNPDYHQVMALGQEYFTHRVPDVSDVIQVLKQLNKSIFLVSAGLYPAVKIFGELLQIPSQHIFAVDIHFDAAGRFTHFEKESPLIHHHGKRQIVNQLKTHYPHIIHIGDGSNDYVTYDLVTRFIGYGGVFYREKIAAGCQYYINTLSLAALLPLSLTQTEYTCLTAEQKTLYHKGLAAIEAGSVIIRDSVASSAYST